jgi:uncharacterized protein (TIGR02246 family)
MNTTALNAVSERRRQWMAVVNEGAVEGYADLVTADVVWLPPAGDPITSRQAFRAWLEPFFGRYDYRFSVEVIQVRAFDGWCAEIGNFRSALSAKGGVEPQEHTGRYFVLWRLDVDGSWRIERYVDGIGGSA